jgi:rhodanese-related sulfurtransferase
MPNPYGAPEISVQEVSAKLKAGEDFVWLDVREPAEWQVASIEDPRVAMVSLSELSARQLDAVPEEAQDKATEIIVFCHHGLRSAQVTTWLRQQGWSHVTNMTGGIAAWAAEVDPSVGSY